MRGQSDGFFDRVEVDRKLPFKVGKLQSPVAWKSLWNSALKRGPLCETALEKEFSGRHGNENRLALLGAFCLSGNRRAATFLESWYRGARKIPEELVFLCLGGSAGGLPLSKGFLSRLALSKKNPAVVRLAAAFAWIQRTRPQVSPDLGERFAEEPEGLFVRLLGDQCKNPPNFGPEARAWVFKEIGSKGAKEQWAHGFDRLAKTLAFLNLVALPGALSKKQTLDLLAREEAFREILSLVFGLQQKKGSLEELRHSGLSLPFFFAGLEEATSDLQRRILEGPGGARGPAYDALWWATGARLVSQKHWNAFCEKCSRSPNGVEGLKVALWRVLVQGIPLPPASSLQKGLPSVPRGILLYLHGRKPQALQTLEAGLSPRVFYALKRLYPPEKGETPLATPIPAQNGVLLWRLLGEAWAPKGLLPGTSQRLHYQFLSKWIAEVFISGSSFFRSQQGLSPPGMGYLPKGIRGNRESFFRILSLFLGEHPFFGV